MNRQGANSKVQTEKEIKKFERWQKASVPVTRLLSFLVFKDIVDCPTDLVIPDGTMLVSNHQHRYDPYLIYFHVHNINKKQKKSFKPIRFPAASVYMRMLFLGSFLRLFGAYDIGNTKLEKLHGLLLTRALLREKTTVLLFPEGRRIKKGEERGEFEKGVNMILKDEFPVVLVKIEGMNSFSWLNFSLHPQVKVSFSNIIEAGLSFEEKICLANQFFNK
jgi:1-acyl-sn-glycerol-3-phosphate acyltransferase